MKNANRKTTEAESPLFENTVPARKARASRMDAAIYLANECYRLAAECGCDPAVLNKMVKNLMNEERKRANAFNRLAAGM